MALFYVHFAVSTRPVAKRGKKYQSRKSPTGCFKICSVGVFTSSPALIPRILWNITEYNVPIQ